MAFIKVFGLKRPLSSLSPSALARIPACILILVCALQVVLTETHALNPSKGGGFGMYSVPDHRFVELRVIDTKGEELRGDHKSLQVHHWRLNQRALMMPTSEILCAMAEAYRGHALRRTSFSESMLGAASLDARRLVSAQRLPLVDPSEEVVSAQADYSDAPLVTPRALEIRV